MTVHSHWCFLLLPCLLPSGLYGTGQSDTSTIRTTSAAQSWVNVGIVSISAVGTGPGAAFTSSLGNGLLTFRFCHVSHAASLKPLFCSGEGLDQFVEFAMLFGKHAHMRCGTAALGAGLGLAVGSSDIGPTEDRSENFDGTAAFPDKDFAAVSLPLEAQFYFSPVSRIGVGFSVLGNINAHETVWGLLVGVQFRG